jgi:hypothetical protein
MESVTTRDWRGGSLMPSIANIPIRGQILFGTDQTSRRYVLRWCLVRVQGKKKSWRVFKDAFPNELEAIAYGKNLIL